MCTDITNPKHANQFISMTQLRTESGKQSRQVRRKPKLYQWKSPPTHTFQVGVLIAEIIYQKAQYIKTKEQKRKKKGKYKIHLW